MVKRDDGDDVDVSVLLADIENTVDEIKATYRVEKRGMNELVVRQDELVSTLTGMVSSLADALGLSL